MAEVQKSDQSGEMTQRFIEFIMMQAQQAALFLGRIPHPQTGEKTVNLTAAKLFIDHLEMLREKTRGNLGAQETEILAGILADLQLTFVQVSSGKTEEIEPVPAAEAAAPDAPVAPAEKGAGEESHKKFSKSYGG